MSRRESPEVTLSHMIRARSSLLWITSVEERRVERLIMGVGSKLGYSVRYWDCATGITNGSTGQREETLPMQKNPMGIFERIRSRPERELWVLRDLSPWLEDPQCARGLKSLARDLLDETKGDRLAVVVVLDANGTVPESLRGSVASIDWPLPTREEVEAVVESAAQAAGASLNGARDRIVDAATGLPAEDISSAVAMSIIRSVTTSKTKEIKPEDIAEHKKLVIDREPTLTWHEPDPRGLDAVGGLDLLKGWLGQRAVAFGKEAREYGLPAPKGILLAGVPGCGKSLTAKAVATAWGMPLLRLDLGALRGSLVGQSEAAIRRALKMAEAVAPCALWADEIEKALAGSDSRGDGGVAADALGTILTWLQDRAGQVFVVATANDASALPPELTRKGRFDEVFFVDLPTRLERAEILRATMGRYGRDPESIDVLHIAARTAEFSGAEIAELVPSAMFHAFADGARPITTEDLARCVESTVPVSKAAKERIESLRAWAKGRARPASSPESSDPQQAAASLGRVIDV